MGGGGVGVLEEIKAISAQLSWRLAGWLGLSLAICRQKERQMYGQTD